MDPDEAFVSLGEFIALARDEGLIALDIQVIQAPGDANGHLAVVQATARSAQATFSALGEAAVASSPAAWQPFLTTLAEMRAKARVLREFTGLDHLIGEELSAPYRPQGEDEDEEPGVRTHFGSAANGYTRQSAPSTPLSAARGASTPSGTAAGAARSQATPTPSPAEIEDDEDADADEVTQSHPVVAPPAAMTQRKTAPTAGASSRNVDDADEPKAPPETEAIDRDMEAKLLKLAFSIASAEGSEISEAEARRKLDAFFQKAFKHPLSKATRNEGQLVVQRLSGDLSRLRRAATE